MDEIKWLIHQKFNTKFFNLNLTNINLAKKANLFWRLNWWK